MDKFERRLKTDAEAVAADVSPELRARIDASLLGIDPIRPVPEERHTPNRLWWASSLTGLAAVIAVVVISNFNRPDTGEVQEVDVIAMTEPPLPVDTPLLSPKLDIRSAEFTSPLEEELLKLRADLEKARKNVREDVDFTF